MASACIGSAMYLVRKHGYGVDLEKLEFIKETTDLAGEPYRYHMDGKATMVIPPNAFNASNHTTSFDVGAAYGQVPPPAGRYIMADTEGRFLVLPDTVWSSTRWVTVRGDWAGKTIFLGRIYKFTYAFSRFLIKHEDQNGTQSEFSPARRRRNPDFKGERTVGKGRHMDFHFRGTDTGAPLVKKTDFRISVKSFLRLIDDGDLFTEKFAFKVGIYYSIIF